LEDGVVGQPQRADRRDEPAEAVAERVGQHLQRQGGLDDELLRAVELACDLRVAEEHQQHGRRLRAEDLELHVEPDPHRQRPRPAARGETNGHVTDHGTSPRRLRTPVLRSVGTVAT
jgi:hypothetical protein